MLPIHIVGHAGAAPVTMVTEELSAVYLPRNPDTTPLKLLKTYYSGVDIVLIEGWISGPFRKIEVWKKSTEHPPLFPEIKDVKALVSDDSITRTDLPVFPRSRIDSIVNFILSL